MGASSYDRWEFKSGGEATAAAFFDLCKWPWRYEPRGESRQIDFLVRIPTDRGPDTVLVEIKSGLESRDKLLAARDALRGRIRDCGVADVRGVLMVGSPFDSLASLCGKNGLPAPMGRDAARLNPWLSRIPSRSGMWAFDAAQSAIAVRTAFTVCCECHQWYLPHTWKVPFGNAALVSATCGSCVVRRFGSCAWENADSTYADWLGGIFESQMHRLNPHPELRVKHWREDIDFCYTTSRDETQWYGHKWHVLGIGKKLAMLSQRTLLARTFAGSQSLQ